jgi:heat shock protein HslJ
MARRLTIAAVTLLLAAPASAQAASPLAGTSWTAKRVGGLVLPPGSRAQLTFKAQRFEGRIDCNRIGGRYSAGATRLRFLEVTSTAIGCEFPPGAQRPDFGRAMARTRGYRLTNGRLLLLGRRGRTLARLVPRG